MLLLRMTYFNWNDSKIRNIFSLQTRGDMGISTLVLSGWRESSDVTTTNL